MTKLLNSYHGGSCCGIKHLHNFCNICHLSKDGIKKEITRKIEEINCTGEYDEYHEPDHNACFLYEAVLTSGQLKAYPNIKEALDEMDFKEVNKFKNVNSNNTCHIFHRTVTDDHYESN